MPLALDKTGQLVFGFTQLLCGIKRSFQSASFKVETVSLLPSILSETGMQWHTYYVNRTSGLPYITRPALSQFWSFKISRTTFLNFELHKSRQFPDREALKLCNGPSGNERQNSGSKLQRNGGDKKWAGWRENERAGATSGQAKSRIRDVNKTYTQAVKMEPGQPPTSILLRDGRMDEWIHGLCEQLLAYHLATKHVVSEKPNLKWRHLRF